MILLASQSPQRAALLRQARLAFRIVPSRCDEDVILADDAADLALARARAKARAIAWERLRDEPEDAIVLGADTVVAVGAELIGKPRDRADAARILGLLQGGRHRVITGHCCIRYARRRRLREEAANAVTWVQMRAMSEDEILAYVASGESDGRAGAYAIQESGDRYVSALEGAFDTVVGLHVPLVRQLHRRCCGQDPLRSG